MFTRSSSIAHLYYVFGSNFLSDSYKYTSSGIPSILLVNCITASRTWLYSLISIPFTINSCKQGDYPSTLRDKIKDVPNLKSSKDERDIILEILACINVLQPASYDRPIRQKHDWTYVTFWRGEDGYNKEAVDTYFGKYIH